MMGLGQENRAVLPSWIQLSAIMVNIFKELNLGTFISDPISNVLIHSMGALFVDDTNMYTWREHILDQENCGSRHKLISSNGAASLAQLGEHKNW
jgi:hypothetical protein